MTKSNARWDVWTAPTVLLWLVFFLAGVDPVWLFYGLRDAGSVVTQSAMINSPHVITLAFSVYLGLFVYHRCLETGLSKLDARGRGLQVGILGLIAFLNFSIEDVLDVPDIPAANLRMVVLLIAFTKALTWLYLLGMMLRYYLLGQSRVFVEMASIFPSSYAHENAQDLLGESSSVTWIEDLDQVPGNAPQPTEDSRTPGPGHGAVSPTERE